MTDVQRPPPSSTDAAAAPEPSPYPPQHPRRWLIFVIVASAMLMGNLDQTVVATALQTMHRSLHVTINWIAWTVTVYQLGMVIAMPVTGRLSDQFGRTRVFLVSVVIFTLASLACGLSNGIGMLIVFRAIQAIGAGGFMPTATGIIAEHFGKDRDRGVGMIASIAPAGSLLGPVLGALVINWWSWRGVFLINIPFAIVIFVLAVIVIPPGRPRATSRADYLGIALLSAAILPMMFGVTVLGSNGTPLSSPLFIVPEVAAAGFVVLLVRHCGRVEEPILPLRLLRLPSFAAMNVINTVYGGCIMGMGALVPLYAQERFGFSPFSSGTVLAARSAGVIVTSAVASMLLHRTGYRRPMVLGFALAAAGMALIGSGWHIPNAYVWLGCSALVMGLGAGIAIPATNNALLSYSPRDVSTISGIRGMFKQLGSIVTISVAAALAARSADPGATLGHVFVAFGIVIVLIVMPLVAMVPERQENW